MKIQIALRKQYLHLKYYMYRPVGDRNRKAFLKEANSIFQCMFGNYSYIPPKQCQKSGQNHSI